MFPIECVVRNRATGSLCKRLGIEDGYILETPLFEFFLKDDDLGDPLINDNHIISFGWATKEELSVMQSITLKVNEILVDFFSEANLLLIDFKLEFGKFKDQIMLGDVYKRQIETLAGVIANLYPPCLPLTLLTIPAILSFLKSCSR